jgi:hypothetical protein
MLWVPAGSAVVVQYAIFVNADPVSMLAEQPEIVAPLAVKPTVPPGGELAFTLAENVTLAPAFDGFWELETYVSVDCANALAESSNASTARTLAALRRENSPSLAIDATNRFDDARMVSLALCWSTVVVFAFGTAVHRGHCLLPLAHFAQPGRRDNRGSCGPHHDRCRSNLRHARTLPAKAAAALHLGNA